MNIFKKNNKIFSDINLIKEWLYGRHTYINNNEIQDIINRNKDCLYSGNAYRLLEIYNTDLLSKIKIQQENIKYDLDKLKEKTRINDKYQSFSKSYNFLKTGNFCNKDALIIIESNINGLDISLFASKHKNEINYTDIPFYLQQQEVISKLDNFTIKYIYGMEI